MSSDEHGVDVVFCSCLQPAQLVIAEVSQILMEWWKASTTFFGVDAFNQPIGAWNMSAVTNMGDVRWSECLKPAHWCLEHISTDEHGVDLVFCSCLQPAQLVIAEVFQAPMGWWKASTTFFGVDAFNQPIGAWNMSAVTNMGDVRWS